MWALAGQGTDESRRLIERAIDSKDPATRMAAISSLMQNPDDRSTDTLLRLARDSDPSVRATALTTLGQIGSERAQTAILDATRYGKTEDRVAAITGLANMDDPRASQQGRLLRSTLTASHGRPGRAGGAARQDPCEGVLPAGGPQVAVRGRD